MNSHLSHAAAVLGITPYLDDPHIREIRITSLGHCFVIHSLKGKLPCPDVCIDHLDAFLALIASHHGQEWTENSPRLATGSPALGFRIQASRPPVSPGPNMVLRKHPSQVYTLDDFVTSEILSPSQRETITEAVNFRKTIIIAGETGSGKTALLNACLGALPYTDERIIVVEDTPEIICDAYDTEYYCAVPSQGITLRSLCADLLRNSPDRIVIGEVRGGEALDALRACQTGHPGFMTVHAKSAYGTLAMLEQRVQEVSQMPQQALIGDAIDTIIHMEHYKKLFRCTSIIAVNGWDVGKGYLTREIG